jgi:LmbE family N-acetylglucosaminyl deacetylase
VRTFELTNDEVTSAPTAILCVGAHCDDIEIGCGGTLMHLCHAFPGLHVDWFIAATNPTRLAESHQAATELLRDSGAHRIEALEYPDGELPYHGAELKRRLRSVLDRQDIDLVLTHSREDAHQDHRFLAELTWQIFRDHAILEYEIPKYDGDLSRPNWFLPLDQSVVDRKIDCLVRNFGSQRHKRWFDADTFRGLMRLRGMECHSPSGFAEAFHLRKGIWQVR